MKPYSLLLLALISCGESDRFSQVGTITSSAKNEAFASQSYYRCDYAKERFAAILRSGNKDTVYEVWGVDRSDISHFPLVDARSLDTGKLVRVAETHLKKKYPTLPLRLADFRVENIIDRDIRNPRNRFVEVTFLCGGKDNYQVVPLLADGRVILSNKEYEMP